SIDQGLVVIQQRRRCLIVRKPFEAAIEVINLLLEIVGRGGGIVALGGEVSDGTGCSNGQAGRPTQQRHCRRRAARRYPSRSDRHSSDLASCCHTTKGSLVANC